MTQTEDVQKKNSQTASVAALLQRAIPDAYRAQQTTQVAEVAQSVNSSSLFTALIFRLDREWLALPAAVCQQILSPVASHSLPHRSNGTLLGIVNVRGQLLLKVSLFELLGLFNRSETNASTTAQKAAAIENQQGFRGYRRMVVIERTSENGQKENWVFEVDELYGMHSLSVDELQPLPTGTKVEPIAGSITADINCTKHVFAWNDLQVSALDDAKLFDALRLLAL